ncbi:TPA: hypothetical protein JBE16_02545 [Legionella pneumophila subsp. pneumophila]|uniref:hypothetical protein n=1 Tax=Legionella sp. PATHC039 TaxID=2992042 RepID=UPI0007785E90|nr:MULTISPECIES: hypothetical protein [Legionella]HAT8857556.1 hypothetical protein [Legionella pneumophila subsp. pneumophila]MCW8394230.1 hypothetical protein [Legionella sp. PATHC039]HAT8641742.1 hypothetical protein [Legionella pneumophila]HAT9651400.1 hypothetical protein [Legionella pneumophila subsp. pneumophila]HAT9919119.1 hypothetical protein [Legionella pneumophila subsp. pneumophila]
MFKDIIKLLAKDKEQKTLEEYTENSLKKSNLSSQAKIKLVELNQKNRLSILKQVMIHTLENLFKKKPDEFFKNTYHYDWWAFPMHVPLEWKWPKRNYDASISLDEAKILLFDDEFVSSYLECLSLYMAALKKHGWNDYPVRYARMLHSLALFTKVASTMDNMETTYQRLSQKGEEAIDFANTHLVKKYPSYTLFTEGMQNLKNEIKKFEEFAENRSTNKLK